MPPRKWKSVREVIEEIGAENMASPFGWIRTLNCNHEGADPAECPPHLSCAPKPETTTSPRAAKVEPRPPSEPWYRGVSDESFRRYIDTCKREMATFCATRDTARQEKAATAEAWRIRILRTEAAQEVAMLETGSAAPLEAE